MPGQPPFPLSQALAGEHLRIVALQGGVARRMTELGLNIGSELTVHQRQGGAVVVGRGGNRFALGVGMAHKIWVRRL